MIVEVNRACFVMHKMCSDERLFVQQTKAIRKFNRINRNLFLLKRSFRNFELEMCSAKFSLRHVLEVFEGNDNISHDGGEDGDEADVFAVVVVVLLKKKKKKKMMMMMMIVWW